MGDDHHGAASHEPPDSAPARLARSGRRDWQWARRGAAAVRRGRRPGPGPRVVVRRLRARPRRGPAGVSRPSGSRATTPARPASTTAAWTCSSVASGRPSRTLSAMERANRCGRCGTQANWARQASGSRSARSTSPTRTEPPSIGVRPSRTLEQGRLPATARPGDSHDLAGFDRERHAAQRRPGPARVPDLEPVHPQHASGRVGHVAADPVGRKWSLEYLEDVFGRFHPFGAGVIVGAQGSAAGDRPRAPG